MVNCSITYLDSEFKPTKENPIYVKKKILKDSYHGYDFKALMNNEVHWIRKLAGYSWSPKIISEDSNSFIMPYLGMPVTPKDLPDDWRSQMETILTDLKTASCFHNDIKSGEILVKDDKLYLIDFHHATATREEFIELKKSGECGCRMHWEDRSAMLNILGNMEKIKEKRVYYCDGMKLFGDSLVRYYNYKRYDPATDMDKPTLFEGLYFQQCYDTFKAHRGKKTVYWNGSDVLRLLTNQNWIKIIKETPAEHLCGSKIFVTELSSIGVKSKWHPILFGDLNSFGASYKPSDTPHVYMTAHPGREREYGVPLAIELAKETGVTFHIYGLQGKNSDNVIYHGFVPPEIMDKEIREYQGAVKLIARDGISQTIIKSALYAQYPIAVNNIDGVWHAPTKERLIEYLNVLKAQKEPNFALRTMFLNLLKGGV